jgi:hypothetical protein
MSERLSVIIPAYGRAATLSRAIASVRAQAGAKAEILVVDDGTPGGLEPKALHHDGLRVVRNEVNTGPGASRNLGVANASHDVIAFLDADDEWLPGSLRPRLRCLSSGACVVGPQRCINERTGTVRSPPLPRGLEIALRTGNPVHPSTLVLSRKDFERAGGFPEDRDCAEDWVFLLRLLAAGIRLVAVSEPAVLVHVDASNTTGTAETSARHALGAVRHMECEGLLPPAEMAHARRVVQARVAGFYANAGYAGSALDQLRSALAGPLDLTIARETLQVPVLGLRGVIRRRRESVRRAADGPGDPPRIAGAALVIASAASEAWLVRALESIRESVPEARVVLVNDLVPSKRGPIDRWRVRRSGEPDAREPCYVHDSSTPISAAELRSAVCGASVVLDLTGGQTYRSTRPGDPGVLRPTFGPNAAPSPELGFDSAYLRGRHVDRVDVILESGGDQVVVRSAPAVIDPFSRSLTGNGARWKAAATLPRALDRRLPVNGTWGIHARARNLPGARSVARAAQLGRAAASLPTRLLMRQWWCVAIQPVSALIPATETVKAAPTTWVKDECALADPQLVDTADGTYLFVERIRTGAPGVIAASRIDDDGQITSLEDVLVQDHHLSYPTVFFDEGVAWMLPETSAARSVRLFRADEFPHRWSLAEVLLDGITAFDPTIHRNDDGYWLWACVAPFGRGRNDELWLFHSSSLLGPWRSHPANPVVDDPRRARPAGGLFFAEGRLIRPAQDCSAGYGRRLVLNEVLNLTRDNYQERPISVIEPDWWPDMVATHSISRGSTWQALDGAHRLVDPFSPRRGSHL